MEDKIRAEEMAVGMVMMMYKETPEVVGLRSILCIQLTYTYKQYCSSKTVRTIFSMLYYYKKLKHVHYGYNE